MSYKLDWNPPGDVAPEKLGAARRVLHFAAQAAANFGRSYLPAPGDYSHISLRWEAGASALAGEPVNGMRAALRFDPLEWLLLDMSGKPLASLPLAGRTLAQLEQDIREVLASHELDAGRYTLKPPFETESHPLMKGGTFLPEHDQAERRELAAYYSGASRILGVLADELRSPVPARCWPHHFDYALLFKLSQGGHEEARTVGLGMSPGDGYYDQPYFYATPWPYPDAPGLPAISPPAFWHRKEWTGAVLRSADLPRHAGPRVTAYWREAHEILSGLLAGTADRR